MLGEGCGTGTARAKHPFQHIQSWCMLQPVCKRPKMLDPQDLAEAVMLWYLQVQEWYYPRVRHPTISSDDVRITTKDVNYLCMGGRRSPEDHFRTAWGVMVDGGSSGRFFSHISGPAHHQGNPQGNRSRLYLKKFQVVFNFRASPRTWTFDAPPNQN